MTEKDYNPEQKNAKAMKQQEKASKIKVETQAPKKDLAPKDVPRDIPEEMPTKGKEKDVEGKKTEKKKQDVKKPVTKKASSKTEVMINAKSVPISTKYAINICRFIKNKTIERATEDLEKVIKMIIAVPMRGEIPHKKSVKGLASGSGRYPKNASQHFITLLKSLRGNANNHDLENPVIVVAMANKAQQPFGRFGRWARKRTHVTLKARSKRQIKKTNKNKGEKK